VDQVKELPRGKDDWRTWLVGLLVGVWVSVVLPPVILASGQGRPYGLWSFIVTASHALTVVGSLLMAIRAAPPPEAPSTAPRE